VNFLKKFIGFPNKLVKMELREENLDLESARVVAVRFRTGPEPYFTVRFGSGSIFS
jgi:hypothetical protein